MVKIRKPKKENDNILPIENTEALNDTLNKSEEFINNNKNIIYSVLGVIVLLILGFSAFSYFKENQNNTAQEEMFQAVYYFEKDSLVQALNGDGNNYGFLETPYRIVEKGKAKAQIKWLSAIEESKYVIAQANTTLSKSNNIITIL